MLVRARASAIFLFLFSIFCAPLVSAQTQNAPAKIPGDLASDLKEFVETPSVSGYENQLAEKIRAKLAAFHPVVDNLGDVIVTIGSGAPHRLIVTPIDEPGFVVSGITADGYLRLERLPQAGNLPPIFNALYSAQPVKIGSRWREVDTTASSPAFPFISIAPARLRQARATSKTCTSISAPSPPLKLAVPVSTSSAPSSSTAACDLAETRNCGRVDRRQVRRRCPDRGFSAKPIAPRVQGNFDRRVRRAATRRRARSAADSQNHEPDEMIYVGRMLPGGTVPGMEGVHRAPRRELGSGVLVGLDKSSGELSGFAADLKQLADANKIPLATDYSADIILRELHPAARFAGQMRCMSESRPRGQTRLPRPSIPMICRRLLGFSKPISAVPPPASTTLGSSEYYFTASRRRIRATSRRPADDPSQTRSHLRSQRARRASR